MSLFSKLFAIQLSFDPLNNTHWSCYNLHTTDAISDSGARSFREVTGCSSHDRAGTSYSSSRLLLNGACECPACITPLLCIPLYFTASMSHLRLQFYCFGLNIKTLGIGLDGGPGPTQMESSRWRGQEQERGHFAAVQSTLTPKWVWQTMKVLL